MEEKIVSLIPTCQVDGCEGGLESEFNPCAVASTGAEDLEITGIEAATGSEIETEQEVVVVQDVSPQAGICEKSTRCKKPAATGDAESHAARLLAIEEQKLVLMREHLAVDRERLEVEKSILFELKHISGRTTTCLSPLIKINYP